MSPLLILVHVEEQFRRFFPKMYLQRVAKAVQNYDSIHFTSEIDENGYPVKEISKHLTVQSQWAWGDYPEMFELDDPEHEWIIPSSSPHEWTWVSPDIRKLKIDRRPILLGGGCDGECLLNMETCLKYLEIPYKKMNGLVYGLT